MGKSKKFLGISILRDRVNGRIALHQQPYVRKVLEEAKMQSCVPVCTPMNTGALNSLRPSTEQATPEVIRRYRQMLGSIMYVAMMTRPDISYAVAKLSQYSTNPSGAHMGALRQVYRYLSGTTGWGLTYLEERHDMSRCPDGTQNPDEQRVCGYSDADFAGDVDTRRSTSGMLFNINRTAVMWKSVKQSLTTLSTMEAEYVALSDTSREAVWLRRLLQEIGAMKESPLNLWEDNQGALALTKEGSTKRSKHIDVRYHFVKDAVLVGDISVTHVKSEWMAADALTKPLNRDKHRISKLQMGLQDLRIGEREQPSRTVNEGNKRHLRKESAFQSEEKRARR